MCEYCLSEAYQRNNYLIHGRLGNEAEGKVYIDDDNAGLIFTLDWKQEIKNQQYEDYSLTAKVMIRYCPWCGRKLNNEK